MKKRISVINLSISVSGIFTIAEERNMLLEEVVVKALKNSLCSVPSLITSVKRRAGEMFYLGDSKITAMIKLLSASWKIYDLCTLKNRDTLPTKLYFSVSRMDQPIPGDESCSEKLMLSCGVRNS